MMCQINFGRGTDTLTLQIHGRTKDSSAGYWEANWLHCTANVSVGETQTTADWQLRNEDLARFLHSLEVLDGRTGQALLDTGDGWLDIRVIRDHLGNVEAQCQLVDNPDGGNSFDFRLILDQLAISNIADQLRDILAKYPVTGMDGCAGRAIL